MTLARHPVFQSGTDKKYLLESRRSNNYARNITGVRVSASAMRRITSGPRFPTRAGLTRKFFSGMIYRDKGDILSSGRSRYFRICTH